MLPSRAAADSALAMAVDRQQIINQVRNAIAYLPMGQRQVITLVDLEGCSYIEVAEILEEADEGA